MAFLSYSARYAGLLLLGVLWVILPTTGDAIPPLTDIILRGYHMIGKEAFLDDIARSLTRVGLGFCIAVVLGIGICLMSALPPLRAAVLPLLELTRPIPPIAWIPLMMVMFGVGEGAAIAIVAMAAFFPITVTLIASAEAIDTDMLRTVRSLGAGRLAQIRHVYGPAMLPGLFVGARLGLGIGWFSVVAAEMVGTFGGLGYGVQVTTLNLDMERFFVYLFAIGLCGFCLNAMLLGAKHRICPWQE